MPDPVIVSEPKRREERVILFEGMSTNGPVGVTLKVDTDTIEPDDMDQGIPAIRIKLKQKDGSFETIVHHKPLLCWYSIRQTTIVWPEVEKPQPKRSGSTMPTVDPNAPTGLL